MAKYHQPPSPRAYSFRLAARGALVAVLAAVPVAALLVVAYRFPVPFVGYVSGFGQIVGAMIATVIYGLIGGFVLLGIGGALASVIARFAVADARMQGWATTALAFGWSAAMGLLLANLDLIIGPW